MCESFNVLSYACLCTSCPVLERLALRSVKWTVPSCTRTETESTILLI
jgi:hypothetical protein